MRMTTPHVILVCKILKFRPDINNFVFIFMSRGEVKAAERGRKTGETSCKCITFVPAEIV